MRLRVDAAGGEVVLPGGEYRVVPASAFDANEGFLSDARAEEAVLFHTDSYGEHAPEDTEWLPGALLSLDAPWVVLDHDGCRSGVLSAEVSFRGGPRGRFVALLSDISQYGPVDGWERAPCVAGGRIVRDAPGWAGPSFRMLPHALTTSTTRDWMWSATMSWSGVLLEVECALPASALHAWLARHAPLPYVATTEARYEDLLEDDHRSRIEVRDGQLSFLRSFRASDALVSVDRGLVAEVARGALGEVRWKIVCGDWGNTLAEGEDVESLREHLAP